MTLTAVETVARSIESRLNDIRVSNGYTVDVLTVDRPRRDNWQSTPPGKDLTLVLEQGERFRGSRHTEGNPPAIEWRQTWNIYGFRLSVDGHTTAIDTTVNEFDGDVEKALFVDRTWSGYAMDTEIESVSPLAANPQYSGFRLVVHVFLRTDETDPTVNRV